LDVEGFRDVVVSALLDGGHRARDVAERGDQDDRHVGLRLLEGPEYLESAGAFHAYVGDHEVVSRSPGAGDRGRTVVGSVDLVAFAAQDLAQQIARDVVIFHDQNTGQAALLPRTGWERRGSVTVKTEPLPGSLSTEMRPPSACASSLQIARPRPVP